MRQSRIPIHFLGNHMVVVHLSLFKNVDTRSANAFGDERIAGFLTWREATKDEILVAVAFTTVFSFSYF